MPAGLYQSNLDIEHTVSYAVRSNTALLDRILNDSVWAAVQGGATERNVVSGSFANDNTIGQYIHYDGRRKTFGQLLAAGERSMAGRGTLYGMACYRNGNRKDVSLNYAVHPEDYAPYLVSDTLGVSTFRQETYVVQAGYSRGVGPMEVGVDIYYEGVAQSRTHDPRHSNYSHLMRLGLSAGRVWAHQAVSLRIAPEWNRQAISSTSLQDGVRYFDFYGFGLWNHRETQTAITYGRVQTLRGLMADAAWLYDGAWQWSANVGYHLRRMNTEEGSSYKNLFASTTHILRQQLHVSHRVDDWQVYMQLTAIQGWRRGEECVYEQQIQDAEQGLYDYVKVATNRLYTYKWMNGDVRVKVLHHISPMASIGLLTAVVYDHSKEGYKVPSMYIDLRTLRSMLATEYKQRRGTLQLELLAYAGMQQGWDCRYSIVGVTNTIQTTMAFIPYQLRGENHQLMGGSIAWGHDLTPNFTLGLRLRADRLHSDYRKVNALSADLFVLF